MSSDVLWFVDFVRLVTLYVGHCVVPKCGLVGFFIITLALCFCLLIVSRGLHLHNLWVLGLFDFLFNIPFL